MENFSTGYSSTIMGENWDVIVVGSGPGGGRVAADLVDSGARVLLLEAGREFGPPASVGGAAAPFPGNERDYSTQMFWGGGLEMSADARVAMLRARCLGGTSIVNQALMDRFDDNAWDDWRDRAQLDFLSVAAMQPHYEAVESGLNIEEIPTQFHNANTRLFTESFEKLGFGWKVLQRAQGDCALDKGSDCIVCLGGCPRSSKQSSLVTTIHRARESGLTIQTGVEVDRIEETAGGVRVAATSPSGTTTFTARAVILAAGSLGSTGILLRSGMQDRLPALGDGFACHPQYMTYAFFDDVIDAHKGAFQAVKSDDPGLRARGLKFENVFAPPIGTTMLLPARGVELHAMMRRYRHMASMEVAIRDEASGRITIDKKGSVVVSKQLTDADRAKSKDGLDTVRELFASVGATETVQCPDTFGLHLMGGCSLGSDARRSVVGEDFRVHGMSRTFVADSSLFVAAPGINPSLTVMALAHRAGQSAKEVLA